MDNLEQLITRVNLKQLAVAAAFGRGEDYFAEGAVDRLRHADEKVSGRVIGSETYAAAFPVSSRKPRTELLDKPSVTSAKSPARSNLFSL